MSTDLWARPLLFAALIGALSQPGPVLAVSMVNDPRGFGGIAWGGPFPASDAYVLAEEGPRIKGYELKQGPPPLGEARMESMRFLTVNGKFGRVVARYQGKETHAKVLAYLEATYGPLDRTPGQFSHGVAQLLNWRGPDTEINLTYDFQRERGLIFFESQTLMVDFQNP